MGCHRKASTCFALCTASKRRLLHYLRKVQHAAQGALQYFRIFARTMQREWFGIDKLRLDKFMMLARKFLHQLYTHLQNTGWCAAQPVTHKQCLCRVHALISLVTCCVSRANLPFCCPQPRLELHQA